MSAPPAPLARPSDPPPDCADPPLALGGAFARAPGGGAVAALARDAADAGDAGFYPSLNARTAIRAAADLIGLGPGDEVLVPAWNCGSEIDPLIDAGATVKLYRIGADGRADPDDLAARIGPRTRALYLIRYFGFPDPADRAIRALADAHGLPLIEDCALSLHHGGDLGDVAAFCFYKFFAVPGGGALRINRRALDPGRTPLDRAAPRGFAAKAVVRGGIRQLLGRRGLDRLKARLGVGRGGWHETGEPARETEAATRFGPAMPGHYRFDPAFRGAAMPGLTARLLAGLDPVASAARRRANYLGMIGRLGSVPAVRPLYPDLPEGTVPLSCPVLVAGRDQLAAALQAEGIAVTPWWAGYHPDPDWTAFPEARFLKDHLLALPIHQGFGPAHLDHIAACLAALAEGPAPVYSA